MDVKQLRRKKTSIVSWIIFLATFGIALFSLIPTVFPALVLRTLGGFEDFVGIDPFEIGAWAFPLLVTNFILLGLAILYQKDKLPKPITNSIKFIFKFEVSPYVAFLVLAVLIGFYITFTVSELTNDEFQPDYYLRVKSLIENYDVTTVGASGIGTHITYFLSSSSVHVFDNAKVIPFIASIALLVLTYYITALISQKRFAGIVAVVIVLQSNVFLFYDTSVSYPNFWILFYLLSLYLIYKKSFLSPISYVASILSKPLTVVFLPMTLFFIHRTNLPKKTKIQTLIYYGIMLAVGVSFLSYLGSSLFYPKDFYSHDFWMGFTAFYTSFLLDGLILVFFLPLTVGLFIASRNGVSQADSIMFLIFGMLIAGPLLAGFSDHINTPYRFVPLIVFFAIGVGLLLSKKS